MWLSPEGHGLTKIGSIQADICIVTEKLESVQEIRAARVADIRLASANDLRSRVLELENQLRYAKDQLKELEEQDSECKKPFFYADPMRLRMMMLRMMMLRKMMLRKMRMRMTMRKMKWKRTRCRMMMLRRRKILSQEPLYTEFYR